MTLTRPAACSSSIRLPASRSSKLTGAKKNTLRDGHRLNQFQRAAAFSLPAAGTFGNVGRNTVIGPGFVNLDEVLSRHFRLAESLDLQFRAEFFNTFNHPNNNLVGRIMNDPTFGQVLSQFDPRELQFSLKMTF